MKYLLVITCTLMLVSPSFSQEELTLEKAIGIALENNYTIKIARNNEQIAQNNYTRGNAGFLPILSADFDKNYGRQNFEQVRVGGETIERTGVRNNRESYGALLNWTVFDGFRMFTTYDQLEELNKQREDILRSQIELLVYNVTSSFYSAALEKERLELFKSNVGLSEIRVKIARDKYELGRASKMEYLQAQVDLNADKSSEIRQVELFKVTKFNLMRFMAIQNNNRDFIIQYELKNTKDLDLSTLLSLVESQNAQLMALRREQNLALYNEKIIKGERLPELGVFADYTHANFESPGGFVINGRSDDMTYGLSARWILFNGFNLNRRIANSKIQYESAKYQYEDQLLEFTTNIKARYINYSNSLDLLHLEEENLDVARENNEIAQERYQIGLSNPLELREAQINLINAQIRRQDAAFAAKQAEVELKYLSGSL